MRSRRQLLLSGGVLALAGISGCIDSIRDDETTPQDDFRTSFVATTGDSEDVDLDTAYWEADVFVVEQTTAADSLTEFLPELGVIAGAIASPYDIYQPEMERTEGVVSSADGSPFGTYRIEPDWAAAFAEGELSESEYADRVAETFSDAE